MTRKAYHYRMTKGYDRDGKYVYAQLECGHHQQLIGTDIPRVQLRLRCHECGDEQARADGDVYRLLHRFHKEVQEITRTMTELDHALARLSGQPQDDIEREEVASTAEVAQVTA